MFKKVLSLVLALIMIMAVFVGCGKKKTNIADETSEKTTEAKTTSEKTTEAKTTMVKDDEEENTEGATTRPSISIDYTANTDITFDDTTIYDEMTIEQLLKPENFEGSDIPDDRDYGGYEFKVLVDEVNFRYEFLDQSDGDIVKEAVINRQKWIEEYVGIDFVFNEMYGGYGSTMNDYASEIEAASGSGNPYDLALAYSHIPPIVAAKGLSKDLAESVNLNLHNTTKEYWGSGIKEEIMIGGRIFWMSDNSSWDSVRNLLCVFVNTEFFARANEGFDQTDLYAMVYGGTWTFENMLLFIQNTYENTNDADPSVDDGDTFGLLSQTYSYSLENWLYGAGFSLTKLNNRGTYEWTLADQMFIDFSDWWQSTLFDDEDIYSAGSKTMFGAGRAMFAMAPLKIIEDQLELDYTVLPLPIYDPNIKNEYSTPILNDYGSWLIPKALKNDSFERSATVLELIAAEGNRRIAPVYFEIYLKRQNAGHDVDMQKMFNIIRNAIVFDIGFLYGSVLTVEDTSELFLQMRRLWRGKLEFNSLTTFWATYQQTATTKLNNLMVDILDY